MNKIGKKVAFYDIITICAFYGYVKKNSLINSVDLTSKFS